MTEQRHQNRFDSGDTNVSQDAVRVRRIRDYLTPRAVLALFGGGLFLGAGVGAYLTLGQGLPSNANVDEGYKPANSSRDGSGILWPATATATGTATANSVVTGLPGNEPNSFMNYQANCKNSPTKLVRNVSSNRLVMWVENLLDSVSSRAQAEPLTASAIEKETAADIIKCIQDIERQRPFLSSNSFAKQLNFTKINVENLRPEDIIGVDTVANWRQNLSAELRTKGFDFSPEDTAVFIDSLEFTFRDRATGKVGLFKPVYFATKEEADRRRNATPSDTTARWVGNEIVVGISSDTQQIFAMEKSRESKDKNCDNVSKPFSRKKVEEKVISTPTAVKLAETPTVPVPFTPTAIATNTEVVPVKTNTPKPPATPSPVPTNPEAVPTSTIGATSTLVPTRTPGAPTPTAIGRRMLIESYKINNEKISLYWQGW